jgi:small subunit ribosomal protein S20
MANTPSARKSARQANSRRDRNRAATSALRTAMRTFRATIAQGDAAAAQAALPGVHALIDKGAGKGHLHDRTASRTKSRLARAVQAMTRAK